MNFTSVYWLCLSSLLPPRLWYRSYDFLFSTTFLRTVYKVLVTGNVKRHPFVLFVWFHMITPHFLNFCYFTLYNVQLFIYHWNYTSKENYSFFFFRCFSWCTLVLITDCFYNLLKIVLDSHIETGLLLPNLKTSVYVML